MKITVKQLKQLIKEQISGMDIDSVDASEDRGNRLVDRLKQAEADRQRRLADRASDDGVKQEQDLYSALGDLVNKFGIEKIRQTLETF